MRKLIVCNIMSLDGYYTGPSDNVMVMPMDPAFDRFNVEHMRSADTLLLGRTSFEGFRSYWPPVADDPDASADNREISRRYRDIGIVVVSDSLPSRPDGPLAERTTVVRRDNAASFVDDLKRRPGGDILVFGSRTMWRGMLAAGLIDELHLMIGGAIVGGGTPMFDGAPAGPLRLLGVDSSAGSENVVVRYAVPLLR
jgi:dihydrofolate reductase